jgi:glyoxylase-like metal-dependent hydrolase (beta-lactamase superfamily II)
MEIVPGTHQVDGVNGNCYIIIREGLTLIDTGLPGSSRKILTCIEETLKRKPSEIRTIILTHHHIDHAGSVCDLTTVSGAKVAIHSADADYVTGRKARPAPKSMQGMVIKVPDVFSRSGPIEPDILLEDGDTIAGLTCIHTPGHTPGSICLFDPDSKALFAGDTIRFDGAKIGGAPPQFTQDMDEAERSITMIATLDFDILLSGHGVPLRPGASEKVREFARLSP